MPAVEVDAAVRIEAAAVRGEDVQEQEQEQEQEHVEAGARDSSEVPVVSLGAGEPPAVTVALVAGPELEQIEGDPEEGDHEEEQEQEGEASGFLRGMASFLQQQGLPGPAVATAPAQPDVLAAPVLEEAEQELQEHVEEQEQERVEEQGRVEEQVQERAEQQQRGLALFADLAADLGEEEAHCPLTVGGNLKENL